MPARSEQEFLERLLQTMVEQDIEVTFRRVAERSEGRFAHASTFTRRLDLRAAVEEAQSRQKAARQVAAKFSKSSPALLAERLAAAQAEVQTLKRQRDVLVSECPQTAKRQQRTLALRRKSDCQQLLTEAGATKVTNEGRGSNVAPLRGRA